ncbi:MAG: zinc ribbon domain-containing protein [Deltaproteobacteria bacterium]
MPIYEFKCLKCNNFFELLCMGDSQQVEMKCPQCQSEELERVISAAGYSMGSGPGAKQGVTRETRACSSGSCTTYTIPGPNG